MNVAKPTTKRGNPSGVEPAPDRVPQKHEEERRCGIAELAYRLYEERGRRDGHQLNDWIEAERHMSEKQESDETVRA